MHDDRYDQFSYATTSGRGGTGGGGVQQGSIRQVYERSVMKVSIGDEVTYLPSGHTGVVIKTMATPTGELQYTCEGEWQGQEYEWLFTTQAINRGDVRVDREPLASSTTVAVPPLHKRGDRVNVDHNQLNVVQHITGTVMGHMLLTNNTWVVWVRPDQPIAQSNTYLWRQGTNGPKKKYNNSLYIYESWVTPFTTISVAPAVTTIGPDDSPYPVASPVPSPETHVMGIDKEEIDWSRFKKIRDML
jgi:hypothetical protein